MNALFLSAALLAQATTPQFEELYLLKGVEEQTNSNQVLNDYEALQGRGSDYVKAFQQIRESHPHASVYMVANRVSIDNIVAVDGLPENTLVTVTYMEGSRAKVKVLAVEDIQEIGIRKVSHSPIRVYFPQSTDHKAHDHHHIHDVDDIPNHQSNPDVHFHQSTSP